LTIAHLKVAHRADMLAHAPRSGMGKSARRDSRVRLRVALLGDLSGEVWARAVALYFVTGKPDHDFPLGDSGG